MVVGQRGGGVYPEKEKEVFEYIKVKFSWLKKRGGGFKQNKKNCFCMISFWFRSL